MLKLIRIALLRENFQKATANQNFPKRKQKVINRDDLPMKDNRWNKNQLDQHAKTNSVSFLFQFVFATRAEIQTFFTD